MWVCGGATAEKGATDVFSVHEIVGGARFEGVFEEDEAAYVEEEQSVYVGCCGDHFV